MTFSMHFIFSTSFYPETANFILYILIWQDLNFNIIYWFPRGELPLKNYISVVLSVTVVICPLLVSLGLLVILLWKKAKIPFKKKIDFIQSFVFELQMKLHFYIKSILVLFKVSTIEDNYCKYSKRQASL